MPVGPVKELLLHMVIQIRLWWAWRMFIVEDELGCFVVSRLQEAHHLSIVGSLSIVWLFTMDLRYQTIGHHFCLKVGCRAALGDRQVRCIPQCIDVRYAFHFQGSTIRRQPP